MQRNKKKLRKIRRHNHNVASQTKVKPIKLPEEPNTLRIDMAETVTLKPTKPKLMGSWAPGQQRTALEN